MENQQKNNQIIYKSEEVLKNIDDNHIEDLEKQIARAEKFIKLFGKIIKMSYNITNSNDWVNRNGNPYLKYSGTTKIATIWSIDSFDEEMEEREIVSKITGEIYIEYIYKGKGTFNRRTLKEIGTANTKDSLFSKGGKLPLDEIELGSIRKKAMTNFHNRLTKNLLGLYHSWSEIESITDNNISMNNVPKVNSETNKKTTTNVDVKKKRTELHTMINNACNNNANNFKNYLVKKTEWTNSEGKHFPGKESLDKLTDNQIVFLYPKIQKDYEQYLSERK